MGQVEPHDMNGTELQESPELDAEKSDDNASVRRHECEDDVSSCDFTQGQLAVMPALRAMDTRLEDMCVRFADLQPGACSVVNDTREADALQQTILQAMRFRMAIIPAMRL